MSLKIQKNSNKNWDIFHSQASIALKEKRFKNEAELKIKSKLMQLIKQLESQISQSKIKIGI